MDDMGLFVAGYYAGKKKGGEKIVEVDPRIKKLDELEELCKIKIDEEWNIRVKIASDIDNMQYFQFGDTHGGLVNYITQWTMYYCVYLKDEFKYATCNNPFWTKYQENYQNADVPNRLYCIYRNRWFKVTSAKASFGTGRNFLAISVEGTYTRSVTAYSWTNDTDRIEGETTDTAESFSDSKSNFDGSQSRGYYIVNGNADDFKDYVYGLYAVCRAKALATQKN